MYDLDQLLGCLGSRIVARRRWIDDMLAHMVFDHLGDESVQRPATGSRLLKNAGTLAMVLSV